MEETGGLKKSAVSSMNMYVFINIQTIKSIQYLWLNWIRSSYESSEEIIHVTCRYMHVWRVQVIDEFAGEIGWVSVKGLTTIIMTKNKIRGASSVAL